MPTTTDLANPLGLTQAELNTAYHADVDALSHSMLKVFRQSARLYHGRFIAKTLPDRPPTPAMQMGTAVHALLFDDDPADCFVRGLNLQRRSNADKEAWAEFEARHHGKIVLDHEDYETAYAIDTGIRAHGAAAMLLDCRGTCEEPIYWGENPARRCKPDKVVHDNAGQPGCIIDAKIVCDPSPEGFRRGVVAGDYHCQAAWYQDGVAAATGVLLPFYFLVAGSKPPHDVAVYELDAEALELGRETNRETVAKIERCRETGQWLNEWSQDIRILSLPKWALGGEYCGQ